ncbi:putative RDD family membrane protein YckC [Kribbella orskensis]|uniref:RDD family membrane protein YckC n=1 Tax=Kribbella orskensis TaxID=2512216 RepID=A0ABY2BWK4_9ACTN|nr:MULTISPECIES: RDD family protein [Kribbella]TCN43920.1 putative RDD family membrane protein YckC [Kribbella sp. VKM Ac-2500]TCO32353.1 putative RDD family membrane protein YckC [Kribbella orskensis]
MSGRLTITGHYAGAVSRAVAAVLDVLIVFASFTLGLAGLDLLTTAFLNRSIREDSSAPAATVALLVWAFCYAFGCLAITARTPGKAIVGLRVVRADGGTVRPRRAFLRVCVFPLSVLLLGLGFVLIVFHRAHRALHDLIAGTAVVYDWGERPAELPGPLSDFLIRANATSDSAELPRTTRGELFNSSPTATDRRDSEGMQS